VPLSRSVGRSSRLIFQRKIVALPAEMLRAAEDAEKNAALGASR
jgi:hypothetical protein